VLPAGGEGGKYVGTLIYPDPVICSDHLFLLTKPNFTHDLALNSRKE
jgi:hypothetical protein